MKADGRMLSHAQLEAIRFHAVKAVQAGQPPTAVARALGLYPARVFVWLAAYRAGGWAALAAPATGTRTSEVLTGSQLSELYPRDDANRICFMLQFPFAIWAADWLGNAVLLDNTAASSVRSRWVVWWRNWG